MSDVTSISIARLKKFGIEYAPLKKASNQSLYTNVDIKEKFPFEWYLYMEQCELRVGSSWRPEYIYNIKRNNPLFHAQEETRYTEWLEIHRYVLQALEEHIQDTLGIKSFDVVAILTSLWPFLPWEPSESGVPGDLQCVQVRRMLGKTKVDDRKKIDVFLNHVVEACISRSGDLPRRLRLHSFDVPYQYRSSFQLRLLKRILLQTPLMFWPMILARDKLSTQNDYGKGFEVHMTEDQTDVRVLFRNMHLDRGHEVLYLWKKLRLSQAPISFREYKNLELDLGKAFAPAKKNANS